VQEKQLSLLSILNETFMNLHLRCFCPPDEYRVFSKLSAIMLTGWRHDVSKGTATRENRRITDFLSFCNKMAKGFGTVSDRPGEEICADFECSMSEYEAAIFVFEHSAVYYSKLCDNSDEQAETAILSALLAKRLYQSLILPDLEILMETETGIYFRDLGGDLSVADSAALICRIFADSKRIVYVDTQEQWAELVHDDGVFLHFASITDSEINQIKATI
jgi:hypothetical protein